MIKYLAFILLLLVGFTPAARCQTTQPEDQTPIAPALAPMYLRLGREIQTHIVLVRRTLGELKLQPAILQRADQMIERITVEIDGLTARIKAGDMPPLRQIQAIPQKLKQAEADLRALLGPDQSAALSAKLDSDRGRARQTLLELRGMIDDLGLGADKMQQIKPILDTADKQTQSLSDSAITDNPEAARQARDAADHLLAGAHDRLAAILSPEQQNAMGLRFAMLALPDPATQPSNP